MKLLIPLSYLNEACYLSDNIDEKKFKMVLKLAQESLKDILGGEFYDEIETQYEPSASNTLTPDNATLYKEYIRDFLAWQSYHNFLGFSQMNSTPTGFREFKDENSDIIADVKLFSLEKNVMRWVNNYKFRMINFLKESQANDSTKYPLYKCSCKIEYSWGITSVSRDFTRDNIISVNRAITDNE